ncbi:MAG TPA: sulfatase-like hydrolase/transferase, partial [Bryobacteraceae bacterium]|nr:sulfatase-like hydrolase/transferase [Bryobacteraceae bacterium]
NRKHPFFLYFATHDIHVPRLPNGRFAGKTGMGPRGDAIAELDWSVGQILDTLDRSGLTQNTLVLFSSDNGPVVDDGYRDEAVERLGDHKPAGPLRGGKYSRFEGGTRVPLLARWPGHIQRDSVSGALVSQVDFFASLASLAGARPEPDEAPDSLNQVNALLGRDRRGREYVIEHAGALAVTQGGWKYIEPASGQRLNRNTNTETANDPQPQLYDLTKDVGEKSNVASEHPERVKAMSALLDRVRKQSRTEP